MLRNIPGRFRSFYKSLIAIMAILMLLWQTRESDDLAGVVVAVADGDTLTVLTPAQERIRVRLSELDAPEKAQPYGQRAKQALSDLCYQKPVRLILRDKDRYGRSVGRVYCDGVDANAEQVRNGLAWVYDEYAAPESDLYALQEAARKTRTGLWADAHPVRPQEWRKARK
jgi:endonuclease YncB( thermonuclease family)